MPTFASLPLLKNSGDEPAQGIVVLLTTAGYTAPDGSLITMASSTGKIKDGVLLAENGLPLSAVVTPAGVGLEMIFKINELSNGKRVQEILRWLVEIPNTTTVAIDVLVHLEPADVYGNYVPSLEVQTLLDAATASASAAELSETNASTSATNAEAARAAAVVAKAAAEAVGDTNDTIMTAVAADSASAFAMQQSATIAEKVTAQVPGEVSTALTNNATVQAGVNDAVTAADVPGKVAAQIAAQSGKVVTGSGSPQGIVTANVGTLYTDTAATLGVSIWRKASGTGNTGWAVLEGDTGWRNISSEMRSGFTANSILLRRIGQTVFIQGRVTPATATVGAVRTQLIGVLNLASGFRGLDYLPNGTAYYSPTNMGNTSTLQDPSYLSVMFPSGAWTADSFSLVASHVTTFEWPTTLPGTAA